MFHLQEFLLHLSLQEEGENCIGDLGEEHLSCDSKKGNQLRINSLTLRFVQESPLKVGNNYLIGKKMPAQLTSELKLGFLIHQLAKN